MSTEVQSFFLMFAGGFLVSSLYDLYRRFWYLKHRRSGLKNVGDIIFASVASGLVTFLLFYTNWCELRSFIFLGLGIGMIIYFRVVKVILTYFH